jgi:hypothetical protein
MHKQSTRRALIRSGAAAVVTGGLLASGLVTGAPASAQGSDTSITARPSDDSVSSGEQFRVRGMFTLNGQAAVDKTVKIQAKYADGWRDVRGARVSTGDDGKYAVRLILSMEGERVLRAVGISPSPTKPNPKKRFTVTVS